MPAFSPYHRAIPRRAALRLAGSGGRGDPACAAARLRRRCRPAAAAIPGLRRWQEERHLYRRLRAPRPGLHRDVRHVDPRRCRLHHRLSLPAGRAGGLARRQAGRVRIRHQRRRQDGVGERQAHERAVRRDRAEESGLRARRRHGVGILEITEFSTPATWSIRRRPSSCRCGCRRSAPNRQRSPAPRSTARSSPSKRFSKARSGTTRIATCSPRPSSRTGTKSSCAGRDRPRRISGRRCDPRACRSRRYRCKALRTAACRAQRRHRHPVAVIVAAQKHVGLVGQREDIAAMFSRRVEFRTVLSDLAVLAVRRSDHELHVSKRGPPAARCRRQAGRAGGDIARRRAGRRHEPKRDEQGRCGCGESHHSTPWYGKGLRSARGRGDTGGPGARPPFKTTAPLAMMTD